MSRPSVWTPLYWGVSHLHTIKCRYQITLRDSGTQTECYVLNFNSLHPFTAIDQAYFRGETRLADARAWGEAQALKLGINE